MCGECARIYIIQNICAYQVGRSIVDGAMTQEAKRHKFAEKNKQQMAVSKCLQRIPARIPDKYLNILVVIQQKYLTISSSEILYSRITDIDTFLS